jgi:two-component system, OmpR family, heavy metal sensor histidine kinase CusS
MSGAASIQRRLSWTLVACSALGLAALAGALYVAIASKLEHNHQAQLDRRVVKLSDIAQKAERDGADLAQRLAEYAPRRPGTRLAVFTPDGRTLYADADLPAHELSGPIRTRKFTPAGVTQPMQGLRFRIDIDVAESAELLRAVAGMLVFGVVIGSAGIGSAALWRLRRELLPLKALTHQVQRLAPGRLSIGVSTGRSIEELQPWVEQFNALLLRLDQAYAQLESFNADVAHELRTPLNNLIGQTEVALSRQRGAEQLHDTLSSNLEELQRLAGIVQDMLFLSRADRGAAARRGAPVSLAAVAREVLEFHEAAMEERQLQASVQGDARVAVDEPLFRRAASNLLSNATRHGDRGSAICVRVAPAGDGAVQVCVENTGPPIGAEVLPRIFDRFFRVDAARAEGDTHHGLGLAIVAAIARMHGGQTFASSADGLTRIGFSIQVHGDA